MSIELLPARLKKRYRKNTSTWCRPGASSKKCVPHFTTCGEPSITIVGLKKYSSHWRNVNFAVISRPVRDPVLDPGRGGRGGCTSIEGPPWTTVRHCISHPCASCRLGLHSDREDGFPEVVEGGREPFAEHLADPVTKRAPDLLPEHLMQEPAGGPCLR